MDEVRALGIFTAASGAGNLLALIDTWHGLVLWCVGSGSEVGRLGKRLALVELVEVWSVLVHRLRAFLVLNRDTNPHIGATDRVAP